MKNSRSSENSPNKDYSGPVITPFVQIEQRVRYSETDQMGVAHNKSYFEWFEIGRTEYCRQKGVSYRDIEERGFYLVVVESFCRYKKPLRYDDRFFIRTGLRDLSPKKTVFVYELWTLDERTLVAEGYTVHIAVNKNGTLAPMPEDILDKIRRF